MTANELRIGNIVKYTSLFNKNSIKNKTISGVDISDCQIYSEDYQAVPLTEEWLVKFGFSWKYMDDPTGKHWLLGGARFLFEYDESPNRFYNGPLGIEIKYVHQLQNLYFALTGKELEISN